MNCKVNVNGIESLEEIKGYWTNEDYVNLLEEMNFPDAKSLKPADLREMLEMAINDFEPSEAAEILLTYRLSEELSEGQIKNISHEMLEDKVAEEYPVIALHYQLFSVNQLLRKAYNGKFPNIEGTKLDLELSIADHPEVEITREIVLKALCQGLSDSNLVNRLFENQMNGEEAFSDAAGIIWELHNNGQNQYTIITSNYWISRDDITQGEFTSELNFFEE